MTTHTTTALGELRGIHEFVPSPLNPRKHFDKAKLEELAASIRVKGIIEPLVGRLIPGRGGEDRIEIVAGERRYRAAKIAELELIPIIIRELTDLEVLELMAIENGQRDDLHPLEEADGFLALMKLDPAYTPKAIAAKIGKSERYVQQRLQLGRLQPEVKTSFLEDHLTAGHADLMTRLGADDQRAALKACFHNLFGEDKERGCISVRKLNEWITHNVRMRLSKDDPQTELFPGLKNTLERAEAATLIEIAGSYVPDKVAKELKLLNATEYRRIQDKRDKCNHQQRAFVAIGDGRGHLIEICTAKTECKVHWRYEIEAAERTEKARSSKAGSGTKKRAKLDAAADKSRKKALDREKREREQLERRRQARTRAVAQLKKLVIKPGPAVLNVLGVKSWTELVADELERAFIYSPAQWKSAAAKFGKFGIKLDAIEAELAASAKAAAAPKKTKAA